MKKNKTIWLFGILVFVIPITAFSLLNIYKGKFTRLPILSKENSSLHFTLLNQDEKLITADSWKGKIVIADFFFTHCPTICPQMTNSLKKVQQAYAGNDGVLLNSFTVDPERDSSAQLKKYASQFKIDNNNWQLLTGAKKEIYMLARNSFSVVATDGDGGPGDFIHSDKLVLIDTQKRIRGYYDGTSSKEVNQLIIDIKKLQHEK